MTYRAIRPPSTGLKPNVSLMAKRGENFRDLAQLLSTENALNIENYLLSSEGGLKMRKGRSRLFEKVGTNGMKTLGEWTENLMILGWGQKVGVGNINTGVITEVKTDFIMADKFDGERYGDYFFVATPGDKIGRLSFTLAFDNQTTNFVVGEVVTGGTSGATAIILQQVDAGATGTLTLGNIQGTFEDNETLSTVSGGDGLVNGTLAFTYTEVANAPKATKIAAVGPRLFAVLANDETAIQYCDIDTGSNPPFNTWNNSSAATEGGKIYFRNPGKINKMLGFSNIIFVFANKGVWAFHLEVIDVGGTLEKIEATDLYRVETGGGKQAIITDTGIYYVNKRGMFQLVGIGQQDIPFSKQESFTSIPLGNSYFDDINLDNADMVEYKRENTILITVRADSQKNNFIICFNTVLQGFSRITNWPILSFLNIDGEIYGGSSNENRVFRLFDGWTDDGAKIWTDFEQEVSTGQLWTLKDLESEYIQGRLSVNSEILWRFSIYNRKGVFSKDVLKLKWGATVSGGESQEYGKSVYGSVYGVDESFADTAENFDGFRGKIRNYQRLRVRFTAQNDSPHQINWFSLNTREKGGARKRQLTKIS